jgi:hypothetical protein
MKMRNIICVLLLASVVAALLFSPSEVYVHAAYPPGRLTVSYGVVGGSGLSTAPTLNYMQSGVAETYTLTTSAVEVAADYGSSWSVTPNPLGGSSGSERWQSSLPLSGTVSNQTILFTFYHQYLESLSYSVLGGGSGYSAPVFTAYQFGSPVPETLTTTPAAYWYDSGSSWTITNPLSGSSSSEQWATSQSTSGSFSSSQSLVFSYQHQYLLTMQVSPSGAGSTSPASGWQNAGSTVPISESPNSGQTFSSWVGAGSGSYTGPSASTTIIMNGAITEVASFTTVTSTVTANSPVITLNPVSGQVGTTVAVLGSGFLASDLACSLSYPATGSTCTVSSGILHATFTVANVASGPYTITATGIPGSDFAQAIFTVTVGASVATITLSPNSGYVGTFVMITGSGFNVADTCSSNSITSSSGAFIISNAVCTMSGGVPSASFTVSTAATPASYAITLTGSSGDSATATFTLTGGQTTVPVVFQESGLGSDAMGNVILVDGSWYDYQQLATGLTLSWPIGSTHTVTANTQISGMNGNQYNFEDWSDDGASTHTITVTGAADYVAYYSYPPQSYGYEVATTTETVTATSYSTVTQTSELTSTITSVPEPVTVTTSATVTTTATTTDTTAEMLYGSLMAVFLALFLATLLLLVASRSRGFRR